MACGHTCLEGYSPTYVCIVYRPIVTLSVKVAQSRGLQVEGKNFVLEAGNSLLDGAGHEHDPPHTTCWAPLESIRPLQDEQRKYDAVG
jgi:hypothetical protein